MNILYNLYKKQTKIKKDILIKTFKIFYCPVFQIRYRREEIQYRIFSKIIKRKNIVKKELKLIENYQNFHPINLDNSTLLNELKKMKSFLFIPNPGNMGDILIAAATIEFFKKHQLNFTIYTKNNNEAKNEKNIVYGGGGGWAWPKGKPNGLERFFPLFKKADKVIILPSSFYNCTKLIDLLDERFILFCREKNSFNYLKEQNIKSKIVLDHDMAFRMNDNIFNETLFLSDYDLTLLKEIQTKLNEINQIPHFFRKDNESIHQNTSHLDISRYMGLNENSSIKHILTWGKLMLYILDSFDTIITDRLHVGVAALLMNKKIFWLDNSYKKISGIYNHTLKKHPNIHFLDQIPTSNSLAVSKNNSLEIIIKEIEKLLSD